MQPYLYVIIAFLAIILITFITLCFAFVRVEHKKYFPPFTHKTQNDLPDRNYKDFIELKREELKVNEMNCYLYYYNKGGDYVFFTHGYWSGHAAYLDQIDTLCKAGYTVFTTDYNGYENLGRTSGNYYTCVNDCKVLFKHLEKIADGKKIYLFGHSWGGYTALALSKYVKAEKVVAICPFDTIIKEITFLTKPFYKKFTYVLKPFRFLYLGLLYGFDFNKSALKNIKNSFTPALILSGKKDVIVPQLKIKSDNVTHIEYQDKGHNCYNTVRAEKYLNECFEKLQKSEDKQKFIKSVDIPLITEQDEDVIKTYLDFLKS